MTPSATTSIPARSIGISCVVAVAVVAFILNFTAPVAGDFWWSDAPRHALNGIFVKDVLVDLPFATPMQYAADYYLKYPALTILFYPPLFYVVSAPFFLVFGDSQAVAQWVVTLHYAGLGAATFFLARLWFTPLLAFAAAILLMGLPEITLWGRQVMLEIPMMAYLTWAAYCLIRHGRGDGNRWLYGAALLFILALYTKLTAAFLLPAILFYLVRTRTPASVPRRHALMLAAGLVLASIPLVLLTVFFGNANVQSVTGIADSLAGRLSVEGWLWYARRLPDMIGYVPLAATAGFWIQRLLKKASPVPRKELEFLALWFAGGYLLLSAVDLKEARHATFLLVPVAIWAVGAFDMIARTAWRTAAAITFAGAALIYGTVFAPVPAVAAYRAAAQRVAAEAPPDSVVLFSGKRDGSFTFNMRTQTGRSDLWTVRSDKILLSVAVRRELGVTENDLSAADIARVLEEMGVRYVVAQRDFWTDLPVMQRLQDVLDSEAFEEIARLPVEANVPTEDKELRIYRARYDVAGGARPLSVNLAIIGRVLSGTTGGE